MADAASLPTLDKASLQTVKRVSALRVPKKQCADAMKMMKGHTFKLPRMRCLVDSADSSEHKLLLLDGSVPAGTLEGLPEGVRERVQLAGFEVLPHDVPYGYEQMPFDAVLRAVLPSGVDVPSAFETVGHIAHFNLRDEQLPWRRVVGQVCLDKNPAIRTVVHKVGEVGSEFRVFAMELLAGEDNTVTEVSQHGLRFRLDFAAVFWNSRLEYEHKRLVDAHFGRGQVVVDVMAGVGPFAVPAAKAGCTVYANDLNPASAKWLKVNADLNRVQGAVRPFCMDGRAFLRLLCGCPHEARRASAQHAAHGDAPPATPAGWAPPAGGLLWDHAVMNLPRTAVEFCDAFRGAFDPARWRGRLPWVHCYAFQKHESEADVVQRVEDALGGALDAAHRYHIVRNVAPEKSHVCVSFRVPAAVAFHGRAASTGTPAPERGGSVAAPAVHLDGAATSRRAETGAQVETARALCSASVGSAGGGDATRVLPGGSEAFRDPEPSALGKRAPQTGPLPIGDGERARARLKPCS